MTSVPVKSKADRPLIKVGKKVARKLLKQISHEQLVDQLGSRDPFLWIYKNIPTEYGTRMAFDRRPYLVQILRDFSPHIVYKKSAQVGITQCGGIAKCLYAVDTLGITSIYTFPTARDVSEFSKARFRYIIRNSKYLQSRMGDIDNEGIVRVGKSTIYFRGTWSQRQAISVPSHLNIHDELDKSDPEVRKIYTSRLDAAEFMYNGEIQLGWEWDFSTPTLPKFGISRLYDNSDQHEWWVRCDGCRRRQRVNFFKNMRKSSTGNRYFGCLKCDKELDRTKGEWIPRNPGAPIRGYHITQPMCAYINANKMYSTYEDLKGEPEGKRKFFNFNLGLEYEDGTETVTRELILNRVVDSTVTAGPIFIGVDQGDILHVEVLKVVDGVRRIIWLGILNSFDELENLIKHYRPRIAVLDGLPNHHNAKELSKKYHNVYAVYYKDSARLGREHWLKDMEQKEVKIPRTDLLDKTASDWNSGKVVVENLISPRLIEDFADQMSNAKRSYVEKKDGTTQAQWVKVDDDHYRHADAYAWIAYEIGTSNYADVAVASQPYEELAVDENIFTENEEW